MKLNAGSRALEGNQKDIYNGPNRVHLVNLTGPSGSEEGQPCDTESFENERSNTFFQLNIYVPSSFCVFTASMHSARSPLRARDLAPTFDLDYQFPSLDINFV